MEEVVLIFVHSLEDKHIEQRNL
ncbi:hypothetical protein VCHENC02_4281, partial [Vibrio harveyi]